MLFVIFTEPDEQLREALHFTTIHPRDGSHAFGEHLLCTDDYCTNNNSEHRVAQSNHTLSTIMLITYHYSVFVHDNLLLFKRNVNDGSFIFSSKFGGRGFCDCLESEPACMVPATPLSEKQKIVKLIMTSRNFFF